MAFKELTHFAPCWSKPQGANRTLIAFFWWGSRQLLRRKERAHIPGTNWLIQFTSTALASIRIFMSRGTRTRRAGRRQPLRLGKARGRGGSGPRAALRGL